VPRRPRQREVTYFASGSNHPGEMLGFGVEGHPFGVAIKTLEKPNKQPPRWVWLCGEDPELVEYSVIWPDMPDANVRGTLDDIFDAFPGWFSPDELEELEAGEAFEDVSGDGYPFRVFRHPVDRAPANCLQGLIESAQRFPWVPVFVDSGAFSEVEFSPRYRTILAISDEDWRDRLATAQVIADALGSQAYIVAPDKVGDQRETLRRMKRYASQVRAIRAAGANILVPLQGGKMDLVEYERQVRKALGFSDFIVAFPMKKGATKLDAIEDYLRRRRGKKLKGIHLLGLGPTSDDAPDVVALITELAPGVPLYMDSVLIRAHVKRDPETGRAVGKLTEAQDFVLEDVLAQRGGMLELPDVTLDWTEVAATPSVYTNAAQRREIGDAIGLGGPQRRDFTADPDEFLQMRMYYTTSTVQHQREVQAQALREQIKKENRARRRVGRKAQPLPSLSEVLAEFDRVYGKPSPKDFGIYWYEDPQLEALLEGAYAEWVKKQSVAARKAASIRLAFGRDPDAMQVQRQVLAELEGQLEPDDLAAVDIDALTSLMYAGTWKPEHNLWMQTVELPSEGLRLVANPTPAQVRQAACVMGRASWEREPGPCGPGMDAKAASQILSEHRWASGQYRTVKSRFLGW